MKKKRLVLLLIGEIIFLICSLILLHFCISINDGRTIVISSLLAAYALFQIVWIVTVLFKK